MALLLAPLLASASERVWPVRWEVLKGLALKGSGCHRNLVDENGKRICSGLAEPVPTSCAVVVDSTPQEEKPIYFGSGCTPAGARFASLGSGFFYLEESDGSFRVVCDDAGLQDRWNFRDLINQCHKSDPAIPVPVEPKRVGRKSGAAH